ncbi:MAG: WbqC family protein [Deltaproteobacteria bacterium]|nr:WbqC family protein [Deltaproteobacteria bacterium]
MDWADIFVIYDDVQYTKRDWRSRNRIKTQSGPLWLSVPVLSKDRRGQLISEAMIVYDTAWNLKHAESISAAYARARYFQDYFPSIKEILGKNHKYLIDLNMELIVCFKDVLNIKANIVYSSALKVDGNSTERLVNICVELGAREYLSGDAGRNYIEEDQFMERGIKVKYHNYKHPEYPQLFGGFVPHLSVVDLLFNCGPESLDYLTGKRELR